MTGIFHVSFDGVDAARASAIVGLLRMLGGLAGSPLSCDAAVDVRMRRVRVRIRAPGATGDSADRVSFWAVRAGGHLSPPSRWEEFEAELLASRRLAEDVAVEDAASLVAAAFPGCESRTPGGALPVLVLRLSGPELAGMTYDRHRRILFLPSPLPLPPGDELSVEIHRSGIRAAPVRARARVEDSRPARRAEPGRPAGIWMAVRSSPAAHVLLSERCVRGGSFETQRATQRFTVRGVVRVRDLEDPAASVVEARLRNLSMGGLFVETELRHPEGRRLEIDTALPGGYPLRRIGTVAHSSAPGFGLRFDPDTDGSAERALAGMLAALSGRGRSVLVVDDDPIALAMVGDAFRERGWSVATAEDGESGLRALTDSLFALDLLVTDVVMRGMDGVAFVQLIRKAGGEGDLPILAVTGSPTPELRTALTEAGADRVVAKALGPERIAEAAEALVTTAVEDAGGAEGRAPGAGTGYSAGQGAYAA